MWLVVEEFPNYEVSDSGEIRRVGKVKVRKPHDNHGYLVVGMNVGSKQVNRLVHRMVAKAFIPNPNQLPEVNHIDGNKHNNAASNLEWVTSRQNQQHAYATGLRVSAKALTLDQVKQIKAEYVRGSSTYGAPALAAKYGVGKTTIQRVINS